MRDNLKNEIVEACRKIHMTGIRKMTDTCLRRVRSIEQHNAGHILS